MPGELRCVAGHEDRPLVRARDQDGAFTQAPAGGVQLLQQGHLIPPGPAVAARGDLPGAVARGVGCRARAVLECVHGHAQAAQGAHDAERSDVLRRSQNQYRRPRSRA